MIPLLRGDISPLNLDRNYISVYDTNFSYSKNWTYPPLPVAYSFFPTVAASCAIARKRDSGSKREQIDIDSNSCKNNL